MRQTTAQHRDSPLADLIGLGNKVFLTSPAALRNLGLPPEDSNTLVEKTVGSRKPMTGALAEIDRLKRTLRKECAATRNAIAPAARAAGSARIAEIGILFAGSKPGAVVSAYSAMGSEIDPRSLLERVAEVGFRAALPVVTPLGNPLRFRGWSPGEQLVARTWGILEPADNAPEVEPDVLLVPLLAFDRSGVRLGYGGGYYDRTLARLRAMKHVIAIGLAFDEQALPDVPCGPYDQRLDWVLTPAGALQC